MSSVTDVECGRLEARERRSNGGGSMLCSTVAPMAGKKHDA